MQTFLRHQIFTEQKFHEFGSKIIIIVLKECFAIKACFVNGYQDKLKNLLRKFSDQNQDIDLLSMLTCGEYSTAQVIPPYFDMPCNYKWQLISRGCK